MPRDYGFTRRLGTLLDDLLGDRASDATETLTRISRILTPQNQAFAQGRIVRRLKTVSSFSSETAVRAACAMHLGGVPAHRLVHFLSASLPGSLTLSQFELAVRFIFDDDPPVSRELLYDLTQYTYLEKKLLAQRGVELASRLKESLTSQLLLYLYLLSLRDDLSNENVHLILLILLICFPELKVRGRNKGISAEEEREIAEAWANAQMSARYAEIAPSPARSETPEHTRETASFFLDKYYSDSSERAETPRVVATTAPPAERLTFVRSSARGGVPRTPKLTPEERSPGRAVTRAPRKQAAKPARAPEPTPLPPRASPAAEQAAPAQVRPGAVLMLGPFVLAAALVAGAVCFNLGRVESPGSPGGGKPAMGAPASAPAPAPAAAPVASPPPVSSANPSISHVVQQGDSVWKIYQSLRSSGTVESEWNDFLRLIKQRNSLSDPDRIYPGNVLSITTEKK